MVLWIAGGSTGWLFLENSLWKRLCTRVIAGFRRGANEILTFVVLCSVDGQLPYTLESNPHPFYSFRGLKYQMRIRIACGLDSRSWARFWKNDRAAVRAVRTIQYNNLLFHFFIYNMYCIIFIICYSSHSPSSPITQSLSVTQSLPSSSSPSSSHRCRLELRTNIFFFRLRNRQNLVRFRFENIRYLATFRDNLSVPYSRAKQSLTAWPLNMGSIGCPEPPVTTCQSVPLLRQDKRDFLFHEASVTIFWDWGPLPSVVFSGYRGIFPGGKALWGRGGVKLLIPIKCLG